MAYHDTLIPSARTFHGTDGKTFDEMLGPSAHRYLADSYRRVERRYRCIVAPTDPSGTHLRVSGTTSLSYPPDWSIGGARATTPPHFSSVDAVLLTERIAARSLAEVRSSGRAVALRHVRLHAGPRARTDLADIPFECDIVAEDGDGTPAITARIGDMRVTAALEISTPDGAPVPHHPTVDVAPGPLVIAGEVEPLDLGPLWESRVQQISEDGSRIVAVHSSTRTRATTGRATSVLDLLRLSAQQAQTLIYLRDGLDRGSANSLWMRQAHFTVAPGARQNDDSVALHLEIARDQTLARGGATWRLFDVVATDENGSEASASLAYLAPAP